MLLGLKNINEYSIEELYDLAEANYQGNVTELTTQAVKELPKYIQHYEELYLKTLIEG